MGLPRVSPGVSLGAAAISVSIVEGAGFNILMSLLSMNFNVLPRKRQAHTYVSGFIVLWRDAP
jgi:hypothetical protein